LFSIGIINLTTPFNERAKITEAIKLSRFTEAKKLIEIHESYTKRYLMSRDVRKHEKIGRSLDTIEDAITLIEGVCAGKSDDWCVDWAYDLVSDFNSELINTLLDEIIKPSTVMINDLIKIIENNEEEFNRVCDEIMGGDITCCKSYFCMAAYHGNSDRERVSCFIKGVESAKGTCTKSIANWAAKEAKKLNKKTSTVDRACKLLRGRANVGEVKYGVTIDRDDLSASDWAQHALEEMLDGAQYLIRLKDEMEALQKENAELKQELKHNQKQELLR
jgi:hypothetical protein